MLSITAAVRWDNGKVYFFGGDQYVRYDIATDRSDPEYPKAIAGHWTGLWTSGITAAVNWGNGKAYFFRNDEYIRYDIAADQADPGYPQSIAGHWPGLWASGITTAVNWGNGKVYFFCGAAYVRYDISADRVDPGYPRLIAEHWPGLWPAGITASVNWGNGKAYFFHGDEYIRYDIAADKADPGYPKSVAGHWPGLLEYTSNTGITIDTQADISIRRGAINVSQYKPFTDLSKLPDIRVARDGSPPPVFSFDTGMTAEDRIDRPNVRGPADAGIAVSSTHICLVARGAFGCYTKAGIPVSLGADLPARPHSVQEFFEKSGITWKAPADNDYAKDGRVVFDPHHRRFFAVFQARGETLILIAVSKSEDPSDGWYTYASEIRPPEALASAYRAGHDYQWVGVNAQHLLISSNIKYRQNFYYNEHDPVLAQFTGHFSFTTADLIHGDIPLRGFWSHEEANSAVPCLHQTETTDAFYVHRDDATQVSVWQARSGNVRRIAVFSIQAGKSPVDGIQRGHHSVTGLPLVLHYGNIGWNPQNADYRNGVINFGMNVSHQWSDVESLRTAIQLVRINMGLPLPALIRDRIFGRSSPGDPAGSVFHYGWPAVATNPNGDLVIGSVRVNESSWPDFRGSVWLAGQDDISGSVSLKMGGDSLSHYHMAGAAADPSSNAIYLAQQWPTGAIPTEENPNPPGWRIHVAKLLGS